MSIKASIYHLTHYSYDRPVMLGPQIIRLQPAPHSRTKVLSHSLKVSPAKHFVNLQQDPYGNLLARFVFPEPVTELKIEVDLVADMTVYNPFDFFVEDVGRDMAVRLSGGHPRRPRHLHEAGAGRPAAARPSSPRVDRTRAPTPSTSSSTSTRASQREIGYIIRIETGVQTPEETLARGTGLVPRFELAAGAGAAQSRASPRASSRAT